MIELNIRVLIIDDEETARFGMQKHIHWKTLGVSQTFLADGCRQAL